MSTFNQGHALLIGVGDDLPITVADAAGLANILEDQERCAYPPSQVHLLTAAQATRSNVLAELDKLIVSTSADSTVVVYFSGHGYRQTIDNNTVYYLMAYGYDLNSLDKTAVTGIEFTERLNAMKAQKRLL